MLRVVRTSALIALSVFAARPHTASASTAGELQPTTTTTTTDHNTHHDRHDRHDVGLQHAPAVVVTQPRHGVALEANQVVALGDSQFVLAERVRAIGMETACGVDDLRLVEAVGAEYDLPPSWAEYRSTRQSWAVSTGSDPHSDIALAEGAHSKYQFGDRIGRGAQGEVWRAVKLGRDGEWSDDWFVIKRMFRSAIQSGWREVHFGNLMRGSENVVRFVEHFAKSSDPNAPLRHNTYHSHKDVTELWLVFHDEGKSLAHHLYAVRVASGLATAHPSSFWYALRNDPAGPGVFAQIARQLLLGVAAAHARGVTHRDIKPSNIIIDVRHSPATLRLADFGSAVDSYALRHLYPPYGATQLEETLPYAPPEVRLTVEGEPYNARNPQSYDMWSIGVLLLELYLALTPDQIFSLPTRDEARTRHRMRGLEQKALQTALLAHALASFCVCPNAEVEPQPVPLSTTTALAHTAANSSAVAAWHESVSLLDPNPLLASAGLVESWRGAGWKAAEPSGPREIAWVQYATTPAPLVRHADAQARALDRGPRSTVAAPRVRGNNRRPAHPAGGQRVPDSDCGFETFQKRLRELDRSVAQEKGTTYALGDWGEKLLWRLLQWDPNQRLTAPQALEHAFFVGPYVSDAHGWMFDTAQARDQFLRHHDA